MLPLKRWALRKGIAKDEDEAESIAWGIALKFSNEGIAPRGYFAKAWNRFERYGVVSRELRKELARMNVEI